MTLRDARQSIGKDREQWKLASESELQSLKDIGAIEPVEHVPRGKQVLPMKAVLTLKPMPGVSTKKKKARVCVCGNFQQKNQQNHSTQQILILAAFGWYYLRQHKSHNGE